MDAILPIAMRWLHLASVIVLIGGIFYARFAVGDLAQRFKPLAYGAIGGILVAVPQKGVSETGLLAHYSAWLGMGWMFLT